MNLSDAEVFLLVWAMIATLAWGLQAHKAKLEQLAREALMQAVIGVAKGEATLTMQGNRVTIKGTDDGDNTSK